MKNKNSTKEPEKGQIAYAQMVKEHPVLNENKHVQQRYYDALDSFCKLSFPSENKLTLPEYSQAVLSYYEKTIAPKIKNPIPKKLSNELKVILLLDIANILGYEKAFLSAQIVRKFNLPYPLSAIMKELFENFTFQNPMWYKLMSNKYVAKYSLWIYHVWQNVYFSVSNPFRLLITATMSAGKSTFINALAGKEIAGTKTLACTGRIHHIYSKPSDDGLVGRWDNKIIIDAGNTAFDDMEESRDSDSYESVFFSGKLSGKRCVILDTPGVNSAEYKRHGECTKNAVLARNYNAVIVLINYEHMATDDEKEHLLFIRKNVDAGVPVIFAVNKVDSRKNNDMPLDDKMRDVRKYLEKLGFKKPVLFLVSSRAAYLFRNIKKLKSKYEIDELKQFQLKFNGGMNLISVYSSIKPPYIGSSENSFIYKCGIGFIEDYIVKIINNYERNDQNDRSIYQV